MKKFIKDNLTKLIISSLIIISPMIIGIAIWNKLPELMAIHFNLMGEADGYGSKAMAVFGINIILLALHWFCMLVTACDKKNGNQHPKVLGMIFWIIPITSLYVSAIFYSTVLGNQFSIGLLTCALVGILFIFIGNYMPKCKQNSTIGIKIKWTLLNEENWNATHRVAGKVWVVGGLIILFFSILSVEAGLIATMFTVVVMVTAPTLYSYIYYKNQLKDGRIRVEELNKFNGKKSVFSIIITTVLVAAVLTFCLIICFTGDIKFEYSDSSFTVKADYYEDITVKFEDIDSVEYRETDSKGVRVFGFGSPKLLMGTFKNNEFGNYTRYSYTNCNSCVVIRSGNKILVVSGIDDTATTDLYNNLIN